MQRHILIGLVLVDTENELYQFLSSDLLRVTLVKHFDVLEELDELVLVLRLLRDLLDVVIRGIFYATLEKLKFASLLLHKSLLVDQVNQEVRTVEALGEGFFSASLDYRVNQLLKLMATTREGKEVVGALSQMELQQLLGQLTV